MRPQRFPHRHRLPLALRRHRRARAVLNHPARGPEGALADQDPVHRRGGLQPRRRVHHIPGGHPLPLGRAGTQQHQRLPGIDGQPDLDPLLPPIPPNPVPDRQRGQHRPLRIILTRGRRPEQRHHRVTDELLHGPAEPLQLGPQPCVKRGQQRADVLRVYLLGPGGKAHQVGEQHGHDLAFLMSRRPGPRQRETALGAELRPRLVPVTARRTHAHRPSLRRSG